MTEEEEPKNEEAPKMLFNFKAKIESLEQAMEVQPTKELKFLCEILIKNFKRREILLNSPIKVDYALERQKFLYKLADHLDELLTAAINMKSIINRDDKVRTIYRWYINKLESFKEIKHIHERTEKEPYQELLPEPEPAPALTDKEISLHRNELNDFTKASNKVKNFKTHRLLDNKNRTKILSFQDEHLNIYSKEDFGYDTMTSFRQEPISLKSTFYGTTTNMNFGKKKCEINTGSDWFRKTGLDFNKEVKGSYSYMRPKFDYNVIETEKKILNEKNREIKEMRNELDIMKGMRQFSFNRSFYKGSTKKKNEMKNVIKVFKSVFEQRKQEEDEKKMREEELKKKEIEKKKEEFRKHQKRLELLRNKEKEKKLEEENKKQNEEEAPGGSSRTQSPQRNLANSIKKKRLSIQSVALSKVDDTHIKYVCPNYTKEDLETNFELFNNNPIQFIDYNIKQPHFDNKKRILDKVIDLKIKTIGEFDDEDKSPTVAMKKMNTAKKATILPYDTFPILAFTNKIHFLRNLGKTQNNFNVLDEAKTSYMHTFTPLSRYDNKYDGDNKNRTLNGFKIKRTLNDTQPKENERIKAYSKYRFDFLRLRKTFSDFDEALMKGSCYYKNASQEKKNDLCNVMLTPKLNTYFPTTYLPLTESKLISKDD